jgi:hypothetical protein
MPNTVAAPKRSVVTIRSVQRISEGEAAMESRMVRGIRRPNSIAASDMRILLARGGIPETYEFGVQVDYGEPVCDECHIKVKIVSRADT